jgi:dienelactone hydrolase
MAWQGSLPVLLSALLLVGAGACGSESPNPDTDSWTPSIGGGGDADGDAQPSPSPEPSLPDPADPGGNAGGDGDGDGEVTPDPDADDSFIRGPMPTVESASKAGPYQVKSITTGYTKEPGYAEGTLYWPVDAQPPFASVAVVPGFASVQAQIQEWGPFLASHGIVAMTLGTNSVLDQPPQRATALLDALKTIRAENTREGSELKGKLDVNRQAVIGWSMGGGGALLAAESTPELKAAISLAGWNPGYDYGKVQVPALLFAAKGDLLAGGQSQGFFTTLPESLPKLLYESSNNTAFFGGHDTFNSPHTLEGLVGRFGLSWLKVFLEGDERYRPFLKEKPADATDYRTANL